MTPNPHRGGRFNYRGEIVNDTEPAQRGDSFTEGRSRWELALILQPLHSTKDTQSKGAELHEPRTTVS